MLLCPEELHATQEKFNKINARAIKRGFTGRLELTATAVEKTSTNDAGFSVTELMYEVEIGGDAPKYNDWQLLASLDFSLGDVIVNTAPGVTNVNRDGLRNGWCDHCKTNRYRTKNYLVGNINTGEQVQVGSTCLKDFLGWEGNFAFLSVSEVQDEIDGFLSGGSWPRSYSVLTVLAAAWAAIKVNGFKPTSSYSGSTKDTVFTILDPPKASAAEIRATYGALVEQSAEQAIKVRDFVLSDEFTGGSEYVLNLKTACAADEVLSQHFGLLVSAPQALARHQERTLIRQKDKLTNEWLGAAGDKIKVEAKIKAIRWIESQFGSTTLYTLATKDGHVVKWFASRDALGDQTSDDYLTITGTIKKLDEYQGTKATVLTRCKAI